MNFSWGLPQLFELEIFSKYIKSPFKQTFMSCLNELFHMFVKMAPLQRTSLRNRKAKIFTFSQPSTYSQLICMLFTLASLSSNRIPPRCHLPQPFPSLLYSASSDVYQRIKSNRKNSSISYSRPSSLRVILMERQSTHPSCRTCLTLYLQKCSI